MVPSGKVQYLKIIDILRIQNKGQRCKKKKLLLENTWSRGILKTSEVPEIKRMESVEKGFGATVPGKEIVSLIADACTCPTIPLPMWLSKMRKAVVPARETITALKLVGRLVYRLTFCQCIFMV